jgi:beta-lactamase class A
MMKSEKVYCWRWVNMKTIKMICAISTTALLIGLPLTGLTGKRAALDINPAEETMVTETAVAIPAAKEPQKAACSLATKFIGSAGIYAKNIKTGQVVSCNENQVFAAASTIKVPVSVVVYNHFYKDADAPQRHVYDAGVELMMTISDNDYFADFLDEIEEKMGSEVIRQNFAKIGLTQTTIRDAQSRQTYGYSNTTTAKDMALFFEQLYAGNLLPPDKTQFMTDALSHTIFPDELARYMQDRHVLHKIGELDNVLADVGIVEGPNGPILISIFTETELDSDYASDQIAALSACIYSRLTGETTAWQGKPTPILDGTIALAR